MKDNILGRIAFIVPIPEPLSVCAELSQFVCLFSVLHLDPQPGPTFFGADHMLLASSGHSELFLCFQPWSSVLKGDLQPPF